MTEQAAESELATNRENVLKHHKKMQQFMVFDFVEINEKHNREYIIKDGLYMGMKIEINR